MRDRLLVVEDAALVAESTRERKNEQRERAMPGYMRYRRAPYNPDDASQDCSSRASSASEIALSVLQGVSLFPDTR